MFDFTVLYGPMICKGGMDISAEHVTHLDVKHDDLSVNFNMKLKTKYFFVHSPHCVWT